MLCNTLFMYDLKKQLASMALTLRNVAVLDTKARTHARAHTRTNTHARLHTHTYIYSLALPPLTFPAKISD